MTREGFLPSQSCNLMIEVRIDLLVGSQYSQATARLRAVLISIMSQF
jgi:hypothetical protein